ncbi:MAG: hypothetical protein CMB80_27790 [Flammeovirgaceae bacterium]|nr:hypothetical protein [Flammeovirgaceae bacterium]
MKKLPFLLLLFSITSPLFGQEQPIIDWMTTTGFENVQCLRKNDTLYIGYENRVFRYEVAALKEIVSNLPINDQVKALVLFPKYQNIPIVQITLPLPLSKEHASFSFEHNLWKSSGVHAAETINKSYLKADISIGPYIYATQIGNYDDAIKIELDAAPTMHLQLTKGLKFTGQLLVPVINNYSEDGIRPGVITLEQSVRLPWNVFATASIGHYNPRRYGARLNAVKFTKDGMFGLGTTLGYTQLSNISGEPLSEFYEDYPAIIARVNGSFRWLEQDLIINASYGTFLYEDLGYKVEAVRQFGEAQIGVHAIKTSLISNAGFSLLLPIPTKKYRPIKHVRLRTERYLKYQYRFRGQTFGGKELQANYDLINKLTELQPAFLYNKLFE